MKKIFAFALVAATAALAAPASAQTFTNLQDIDVSALEGLPTGIAYDETSDTAYVGGFESQSVLKIADVTTDAPVVTILVSVNTASANIGDYPSGRGITTVNFTSGGNLVATGDQGTDGGIFVFDTSGSLVTEQALLIGGSARRVGGAIEIGSGRFLATQTGGGIYTLAPTLDALAGTSYTSTAASFNRDMLLDGTDLYVSSTGNGNARIQKLTGGDAIGNSNLTGYAAAVWYDSASTFGGSSAPLTKFTYSGTDYIGLGLGSDGEIHFVDASAAAPTAGTPDIKLDNATDGIHQAFGLEAITNTGGAQFLLVAQKDLTTGDNARVSVYGVDGAVLTPDPSSAKDWAVYD